MRILGLIAFLSIVFFADGRDTDEYIQSENYKAYRVVYQAQTWNKARDLCEEEGAKLAVPKTQNEFDFIQNLVRGMHYPSITGTTFKLLVWLGINNLEDYRIWKNIDGQNINDTGFYKWAGQNGKGFSDNPNEPHCGGIDAVNPGFRDWWCHRPQPYICEKSIRKITV